MLEESGLWLAWFIDAGALAADHESLYLASFLNYAGSMTKKAKSAANNHLACCGAIANHIVEQVMKESNQKTLHDS